MIVRRRLLAACAIAGATVLACGQSGNGAADATGGSAAASDGTPSGGAPGDGGGSSTGGNVGVGGAPSNGGGAGGASSGGDAGGDATTGGAAAGGVSGLSFEEIRCWEQDSFSQSCFGRLGTLWAEVAPDCSAGPKEEMTRALEECGVDDDATGWDETWCTGATGCFGRRGAWFTQLGATCQLSAEEPVETTPAQYFCFDDEQPTGWDNLGCYEFFELGNSVDVRCYGSQGIYYPEEGLLPTCALDLLEERWGSPVQDPTAAAVCD